MPAAPSRLILAAALALAVPGLMSSAALAQDGSRPQGTQQGQAAQPDEEITVIAPRRTVPDYQTFDEFQREEFEKIRGRYEAPPPQQPRGDEVLSTSAAKGQNHQSDLRRMMREAPRIRDLVE